MEASLERTEIVAGEAVSGSLSLANVGGKKIRSIKASILGIEHRLTSFTSDQYATNLAAQIYRGGPAEGQSVPFRLAFPANVPPSFKANLFRLDYRLELRADVALGTDVVLRVPIVVHPAESNAGRRAREGRVAPVGRERRAVVWNDVATRLGLENDVEQERMLFREGDVSLVVQLDSKDGDIFVGGALSWPSLGLDLTLGKREWTSLFGDHVDVTHEKASKKFTIHAREHAQAQALLTGPLLDLLVDLDEVLVDDTGARLAQRGNAQVVDRLARVVARYKAIA